MNEEEKQAIERMKRDYELAKSEDAIDIDIFTEDIKTVLNLLEKKDEEIEKYKMMLAENCARTLNSNLKQKHKHEEDLEALHLGWKEEIEKKDDKLKDIKNHIKAELKMIDKLYNEVGWVGKEQYDGMKAAYKCLLNIYFENEVVEEDKLYGVKRINRKNIRNI